MTIATALVSGNDPSPQIVEEAVHQALARAGRTHANGVILLLTPEFARHAQAAVTAAARAAQCTQVAGGIASGVFCESGWSVDRPAAAVMILGGDFSLGHSASAAGDRPLLSYAGGNFPAEWSTSERRFGGCYAGSAGRAETLVWQQSRLLDTQRCSVQLHGAQVDIGVSSGLRLLGKALPIERSNGYDLERLGGHTACRSLYRVIPDELRQRAEGPPLKLHQLHQLSAVLVDHEGDAGQALADGRYRPLAIIATNADHSLTLTEPVAAGQHLAWAIRETRSAETDMRQMLERLAARVAEPVAALMFSCIGRGPYFYGGEDRDLEALCQRFPGLPVLGSYGTGQIAPTPGAAQPGNRELQNAVVTALISRKGPHVQSIT